MVVLVEVVLVEVVLLKAVKIPVVCQRMVNQMLLALNITLILISTQEAVV